MFLRKKSVVITIFVLIGTMVFSALGLGIYSVVDFVQDKVSEASMVDQDIMDGGGGGTITIFDLADGAVSSADNNVYIIGSLTALQNFQASVNDNGVSFENKTVKLTADVDCGGQEITIGLHDDGFFGIGYKDNYFKGIFNGQNFTISNFVYKNYLNAGSNMTNNTYGFFMKLDNTSVIQNLKLKKCTKKNFSSAGRIYVGAIAGYCVNAKINNCFVENLNIEFSSEDTNYCVGGIFACGYATVENCFVKNITTTNAGEIIAFGPANANESYDFNYVGQTVENTYPSTITNCVAQNSNASSCVDEYCSYTYVLGSQTLTGSQEISHTVTNCYINNENDEFEKLSSISSSGGKNGTTWYYESNYNDGWPYLRQFMKNWSTISFVTGTGGSVDKSSIVIPDELFVNMHSYFSGTTLDATPVYNNRTATYTANVITNPISIYGQTTTATASTGYVFSNWTIKVVRSVSWRWIPQIELESFNSQVVQPMAVPLPGDGNWVYTLGNVTSVTCTANFSEVSYQLSFANITLEGTAISCAPTTAAITVKQGQKITVSTSHTATETTITYTIGSQTITYTLEAKYTINSYGTLNGTTITNNMETPDLTHNSIHTITPIIELRQHGSEFN